MQETFHEPNAPINLEVSGKLKFGVKKSIIELKKVMTRLTIVKKSCDLLLSGVPKNSKMKS